MAKELIANKEAFYAWLSQQPLIIAARNKENGMDPPIPEKPGITDEDRAFAEAMKGMA